MSRGGHGRRGTDVLSRNWFLLPEMTSEQAAQFHRMMDRAVGEGVVTVWDDGNGRTPWYNAHSGAAERTLHAAVGALFDGRRSMSWKRVTEALRQYWKDEER